MNILKSIFKYFNDKLLYLILIVGIPAIVAGFCITGEGVIDLLLHYGELEFGSFVDVYLAVLGRKAKWLYFQPLALVVLALGISLLYATVDSHMRMGEFTIKNVVRKLDYNFVPSLKFVFVIAIAGHLIFLLLATLIYLYYKTTYNLVLAWALTDISIILFGFLFLVIITWLLLWLPTMLHTGAGDNRAFIMSSKQIAPVFMKVLTTLFIPLLPYILMMILNCYFEWGVPAIFDALSFAIFGIWIVVTMNTVYYDLNNIEREDLKTIAWRR